MKNWKYLLVSLIAVLVLMMVGSIALADEVSEPTVVDEALITHTPVYPIFKNGTVDIRANNDYLYGDFFVTYYVDYSVTNGVYTVNSSSATLDSHAVTIYSGDFYGSVYVTHAVSKTGRLSIVVNYQVKQVLPNGNTVYSGRLYSSTSIQLPAQ